MSSPNAFATPQERRHADLMRSERTMVWVRALAVCFGLVQVVTYTARPYPPGYREAALGLMALMALLDIVVTVLLATRRPATHAGVRALAVTTVALDTTLACGLVFAYSFDPSSAHWAILFVVPLLGAARFRLAGALATWAAITVLYVIRQAFAAATFDGIGFSPSSIGFRMGLALLVALVAGLLAKDLASARERTAGALEELARIDQLRARLVGSLAHDIRSPIAVVSGALKSLDSSKAPSTQTELVGLAIRQTDRLSRLATGILDLARLDQGQLELDRRSTNLAGVVAGAVAALAPSEGEVTVNVPADLLVNADPDRLDQIVYNLIGNAMRHGRPPIEVCAAATAKGVLLSVSDHGSGVPEEQRSGLFDAFVTSSTGGVGLGLWLVRALVDAHGGSVDYQPGPDGGARFEAILPEA